MWLQPLLPLGVMSSDVEFNDVVTGRGAIAERDSQVVVHVRGALNRGEVFMDTRQGEPLRIELQKRDCIAGLRYGIVGMQVGGRRELVIGPHLGSLLSGLETK
jgi:peptidylprolyl isomerase